MAQPTAASTSAYSGHYSTPFTLSPDITATNATGLTQTIDVMVDSSTGFAIASFATDTDATYTLVGPDGKDVPLSPHQVKATLPFGDDTDRSLAGTQWNFEGTHPFGVYVLTITSTAHTVVAAARTERTARRGLAAVPVDGYVIVWNEDDDKLYAHLTNPNAPLVGSHVGVVARFVDSAIHPFDVHTLSNTPPPANLNAPVVSGTLYATFPDGHVMSEPMQDDGAHGDGLANDGEYGGDVMATQAGKYVFRAELKGVDATGHQFVRTYVQELMVDLPIFDLAKMAVVTVVDHRARVRIPITSLSCDASSFTYRPYFELWSATNDGTGTEVPVAFATNLAHVQSSVFRRYLELEVDLKWIQAAQVTGPFTLKNVRVTNIETNAMIASAAVMPLTVCAADEEEELLAASVGAPGTHQHVSPGTRAGVAELQSGLTALPAYTGEITWEMRNGVKPVRAARVNGTAAPASLVLIHGFCADKNPFESQPGDWTNAVYYSAAREGNGLGVPNSIFADNVLRFIEAQELDTFSLVGQSQGGMIALHILNYFHTGLDDATGGRKIQSIATPYQGNTALGSFNGIIDAIAGPDGCEGPYELTRSGAAEWLAGITPENLAQTNYYYTEYKPGGLFGGGWCNTLMNLVLNGKNDGVCEVSYATPNGAGTDRTGGVAFAGQCHAADMEWPPSFWDSDRNKLMDAAAAR